MINRRVGKSKKKDTGQRNKCEEFDFLRLPNTKTKQKNREREFRMKSRGKKVVERKTSS